MGAENKVKRMIEKKKKDDEISDITFLTGYLDLINSQIKQLEHQLSGSKLHRKHIISITEKIKKKK